MKKQIIVALLPLVLAYSCKTSRKTAADNNTPVELITDDAFRKPLADKDLYKATTEVVPLDTVYISKDTLNIFTKKISGCETDNFKLIWNGDLGKATPPVTVVKLFQYVEGACRERHRFHLVYNISSLKPKVDTAEAKTTLIGVGGWHGLNSYTRK